MNYNKKVVVLVLLGSCLTRVPSMQGAEMKEVKSISAKEKNINTSADLGLPSLTEILFSNTEDLFNKYDFGEFLVKYPWLKKFLFAQYTLMIRGNMHMANYFKDTRISGPNPTLKELVAGFSIGIVSQALAPVGYFGAMFALAAAESKKRAAAIFSGMATTATLQGLGIYYLAKKIISSIKK